jgi:hypothetical protein
MAGALAGAVLSSWVAVPAFERDDGQLGPSVPVPEHVPARVGANQTIDLRAQEASAERLAESG